MPGRLDLELEIQGRICFVPVSIRSGTAMKHSWIARSASLPYSLNHVFGNVSLEKTNFRPAHSRLKLTAPSMAWIAGQERIVTPCSSKMTCGFL